jgi:hypothetical protein
MKTVHYREGADGPTACGTGGRKAAVTTDALTVTCRKCPTTLRWHMWVHGLSYTDAAIITRELRLMATTHPAQQPAAQ